MPREATKNPIQSRSPTTTFTDWWRIIMEQSDETTAVEDGKHYVLSSSHKKTSVSRKSTPVAIDKSPSQFSLVSLNKHCLILLNSHHYWNLSFPRFQPSPKRLLKRSVQSFPLIPLLTLRNKEAYLSLLKNMPSEGIKIKHADSKHNGMQIHINSSDYHRRLTRPPDINNYKYYTYRLHEDNFWWILRKVRLISPRKALTFSRSAAWRRETAKRTRTTYHLCLPKRSKNIYNLTDIIFNRVKKEVSKTQVNQCHRC